MKQKVTGGSKPKPKLPVPVGGNSRKVFNAKPGHIVYEDGSTGFPPSPKKRKNTGRGIPV